MPQTKISIIILITIAIEFFSCKTAVDEKFLLHESGLEYYFVEKSKDTTMPNIDDVVVLNMIYTDEKDSVLFDSKDVGSNFKMKVYSPSHINGSIEDAFMMMQKNDSAIFLIDAKLFYNYTRRMELPTKVKEGSKLKFYIRLKDVLSTNEVAEKKQQLNKTKEEEEKSLLQRYLIRTNITEVASLSGLIFISEMEGIGETIKKGDNVTVHYTGTFIDGKPFDSSLERNEPFEFKAGVGRVIKAWDEAVMQMKKGGKAKIIAPSWIAYGKEGYLPIIAPYTTLVFYIEVIDVTLGKN